MINTKTSERSITAKDLSDERDIGSSQYTGRQKQKEDAQSGDAEKFATLFHNTNDAIYLMKVTEDGMPGRLIEVNDTASRQLGYTKNEFLSMTPEQIDDPEAYRRIPEFMKELLIKKHMTFETVHISKNGVRIPVEVGAHLFSLNGEEVIIAIARDISERKKAEEVLKYRLAFEELITSISTGFISLASTQIDQGIKSALKAIGEFVGADRSYVILFSHDLKRIEETYEWCKPGLKQLMIPQGEYTEEIFPWTMKKLRAFEKVYVPSVELLPEEAQVDKKNCYQQGVKSYISIPMSYAKTLIGFVGFASETEEKRWPEDTKKLLTVVGEIFTNTIERKKSEETLYLSEERFFKVFNTSPGMIIISSYEGRVINVNNTFLEAFKSPVEKVVGKNILDLKFWLDAKDRAQVIQLLDQQGSVRNKEIKFKSALGEIRTGLISIDKIELNGEQCILGIINDVTELLQLEREITRLDRLNLVGKMASIIAHEIRNPLTTVHGFLQILRDKKDYAKDRENFDLMIDELIRANEIISEYLSLAKSKPIDAKKKNLNSIIKALKPMLTANAIIWEKNISFQLGNISDILVDEKEIRQLILNLVRNGFEAMESGSTLTIRTFMEDHCIVLAVQDQGMGIDQSHSEKIGTPFYTTKEHGTGLGLAVCYSIAARHNAKVTFKSGPAGTTFYVCFNHTINKSAPS